MSDKELEEYINKIEPNFDSHLEKGTIEMSNEYYNLLEEKMVRLINKNQKLKERIEYLERSNDRREDTILEQRQEISNLEDNWNILNEYLEKRYKDVTSVMGSYGSNTDMLYGKKEILKEILQQIQKYTRR